LAAPRWLDARVKQGESQPLIGHVAELADALDLGFGNRRFFEVSSDFLNNDKSIDVIGQESILHRVKWVLLNFEKCRKKCRNSFSSFVD